MDGKDAIAKGMYFFIVEVNVKGKQTVTLPEDNDIVVIAATEYSGAAGRLATPVFDEVDKNREQTFKFTLGEYIRYQRYKNVWHLNDKDNFLKDRNRGRIV